eukprot:3794255-Amphidinium_carterae.1
MTPALQTLPVRSVAPAAQGGALLQATVDQSHSYIGEIWAAIASSRHDGTKQSEKGRRRRRRHPMGLTHRSVTTPVLHQGILKCCPAAHRALEAGQQQRRAVARSQDMFNLGQCSEGSQYCTTCGLDSQASIGHVASTKNAE